MKGLCVNCKHKYFPANLDPCFSCLRTPGWPHFEANEPPKPPKPLTNADHIRAMTDEELADWLCEIAGWLPQYEGKAHPILKWLKQEVKDGD